MARHLDAVPWSGIIRIRDMMFTVKDPYRLDQGDVSFDAPPSVKEAMTRALAENRTHYLQSSGVPRLRELVAAKLHTKNHVAAVDPEHITMTNGGTHALYVAFQALLEPGDEVLVPDPVWPPTASMIQLAQGIPVGVRLYESKQWRYEVEELRRAVTPRTRAIYINSPHNPTGGVLTREDLAGIADLAREHHLWVVADEAYEDLLFQGEHVSIATLPGMYERTLLMYTFSKSYAMTGLRLGYLVVRNDQLRDRVQKVVLYTTSNVASVVQFGGIGALEGPQDCVREFREELRARRDLFYAGIASLDGVFAGTPPKGAFYAFVRIDPRQASTEIGRTNESLSWAITEHLVRKGRIGCVPGVDFGPAGEGYIRFAFGRERRELTGAIESMRALFAQS